jgi:stage II sporulation protein D
VLPFLQRADELDASKQPYPAYFVRTYATQLVLSGRGHGHGVGMCQYGAEAMAKKGAKMDAILTRYYPGATIVKSYA